MTNIKLQVSILDAVKALVVGILIPFFIFIFSGVEWMYVYMVMGAMFYNFVLRESTPAAYVLIVEAIAVVGFYAVLAVLLFFGAVLSAFGG